MKSRLAGLSDARDAEFLSRYFKTGRGEYGEGDRFRGIRVAVLRQLARQFSEIPIPAVLQLLQSGYHEDRVLALLILVLRFQRGDEIARQRIYDAYLQNTHRINNWDLVDTSILLGHTEGRSSSRDLLLPDIGSLEPVAGELIA